MSWVQWEEQTCEHIDRLYRAIGSRVRSCCRVRNRRSLCDVTVLIPLSANR